ncbi:MAG: hypothetical protein RIC15_06130 [Vicingaceae bacterium]
MRSSILLVFLFSATIACKEVNNEFHELVADRSYVKAAIWLDSNPNETVDAMDMLSVARYYREGVNFEKSRSILERLLKSDSTNVPARLLMADVMREQTDYNPALVIYNELAEIDSVRFIVLAERARLYTSLHEFDKAQKDVMESKSMQPKYYASFLADGLLQYAKGDMEHALDLFEIAENLDPGLSAEASLYAGVILLKSNINHDARFKFDRAIEVGRNINKGYAFINRGICQLNITDTVFACEDFDSAMTYMPEQAKQYISNYCGSIKE